MIDWLHGELGFLNKPKIKVPRNLNVPTTLHERVLYSDQLFVVNNHRTSIYGGGISFDPDQASMAALGEYLERYASSFQLPDQLIRGTYAQLSASYPCYDPAAIRYFTAEQYQQPNFKLKRLTATDVTHWIWGTHYLTQEETLFPFFMANMENIQGDGLYHKNTSTGTACHTDRTRAIEGGLLECIERDGFAKFWYYQGKMRYTKYTQSFILEQFATDIEIRSLFDTKRVKIIAYDCSEYAYCPVFIVFILFKKKGKTYQSVGSAARLDRRDALVKATIEAYQGIEYTEFACEQHREQLARPSISSFDFTGVDTFKKHYALYNLYPELAHYVPVLADMLGDDDYTTSWQEVYLHHVEDLSPEELRKKGLDEVYVVELSTADIRQLGFEVIKVITPQLNLLTGDFNYPYLGLLDPKEDWFTDFPHPFP